MRVLADDAPRLGVRARVLAAVSAAVSAAVGAAVCVSPVARVGLPIRAEMLGVWILAGITPGEVFHAPGEKDEKQPHP
jgi:hypothetical protein